MIKEGVNRCRQVSGLSLSSHIWAVIVHPSAPSPPPPPEITIANSSFHKKETKKLRFLFSALKP